MPGWIVPRLGASPRVPPSLNELQSSNTKPMSSRGAVNSGQDCMRSSRVLRVGRLAGVREPRIKRIEMAPPRRIVEDESCPKPPWGAVLTPGMLNEITFTPSAEPASYIAIKHCVPFPSPPLVLFIVCPSFKPPGRVASFIYAPLNRINQTEADSAAARRSQVPKSRKWRQRWFFEQIIVWKVAYYTSNREVFSVYEVVLIRFSPETGNKLKF